MKILQAKKGQFVYYDNELHKICSTKSKFGKNIYLCRLKDMRYIFTKPCYTQKCEPKHMDTFVFCGDRYTIDKHKTPQEGDCILITKPNPDFLDLYTFNDIETVEKVEDGNVVTTRDNGVKGHEYVTLVPGEIKGSEDIAYFNRDLLSLNQLKEDESSGLLQKAKRLTKPVVGDIYYDAKEDMQAMVVARSEMEVIFGHGVRLHITEMINQERFTLTYCSEECL